MHNSLFNREAMSRENIWKHQRVVVTGGSGFLGSYIVEKLNRSGADNVFVPRSQEYDLVQPDHINRMVEDSQPDIIIHAAALAGGIGANSKRPAEFFYDNLMMGVPLMHKAWESGVKKFVALGTICSYPKFAPTPFREENLWDGYPEETNAPYGLAKKMLLVQAQAYRQQYGLNAIFLLPVNLYGPRDNFDLETSHVIPALIRKFIEAKERGDDRVELWGDGSPTREFLYVEDAAEAVVLAAESYDDGEPVNIGSGVDISIKDLAETIAEMTGYNRQIYWDTSKPNGQPRRLLDVSRAQDFFGFRAQTVFREGLKKTIDWFNVQREVAVK
jgi:GDP-L-fucose synthase